MSTFRTEAEIQADLSVWYAARTAAAAGKSLTISTSAGSRTVSQHDMSDINETISILQRELIACQTDSGGKGLHSFSVANFNNDRQNRR
jgi:hypothetical protein